MASATAPPIPSAAPVTTITFPFMLNCSSTFSGPAGTGLGYPGRGVWHSEMDIDMFAARWWIEMGSGIDELCSSRESLNDI